MSMTLQKSRNAKGVNALDAVNIGGINQYILQRGKDKTKPVILFLHGGPGNAQIGYMPKYQEKLEEDFIVVNWDQRGSGLSYSEAIPKETMTVEQFISDAVEVTNYLRNKFDQEKIYLVGHSWGSLLGMKVIQKYPELFHGYIGVGQVAHMERGEEMIYEFVKDKALVENNKDALQELEQMGPPPYKEPLESVIVVRKWVSGYNGISKKVDLSSIMVDGIMDSTYYRDEDLVKWQNGSQFTVIHMLESILDANLFEEIKEVTIPVTLFGGRHDYAAPSEVALDYLETLKAPQKEFVWFENSAHMPMIEECGRFQKEVLRVFK